MIPVFLVVWFINHSLKSLIWSYLVGLHLALLYSADIVFFSLQIEVYDNPVSGKSISAIFVTCNISDFSIICYGNLWLVIFNVTVVIVLDNIDCNYIWEWTLSVNVVCILIAMLAVLFLSSSLQFSLFPEAQPVEIRPINNPTRSSKCSNERHLFL